MLIRQKRRPFIEKLEKEVLHRHVFHSIASFINVSICFD